MSTIMRLALTTALLLLTACGSKHEPYRPLPATLTTSVWRTHDAQSATAMPYVPPERAMLPELRAKDDLGIAVSGGGGRAAVAALGQFRALRSLGLLERARYVSSDSGGSWFCGPFEYANPKLVPDDAEHPHAADIRKLSQDEYDRLVLGNYEAPEKLNLARLKDEPEGSFVRAVSRMHMRIGALFDGYGTESFSRVVSDAFLKQFGLGAADKSFTWSRGWFDRHRASSLKGVLTADDFYFAVPGRPFLIMNETIVFPNRTTLLDKAGYFLMNMIRPGSVPDYKAYYPVESTPLYTGVRPLAPAKGGCLPFGAREKTAGGGYVESFAYGSSFEQWEPGASGKRAVVRPVPQSRKLPAALFSLSDAVANSGGAVGAVAGGLADLVNLEAKHWHWSPAFDDPKRTEQRMPHVDGGACDNSGVIALLARKTSRIICLSNAIFHLPKNGGRGRIEPWDIPTDVTALFGMPGSTSLFNMAGQAAANQVLDRRLPCGCDALEDLAGELSERNISGRPLVVCREYRTVPNARQEIAGGQRVRVCWVFLTFTRIRDRERAAPQCGSTILERWISRLPDDSLEVFTRDRLIREHGLKNFPAFSIIKENEHTQQLYPVQANALAQFAAFCLKEAAPEIRRGLGL